MFQINQPPAWQCDPNNPYVPIRLEGEVVGFCRPDQATQIVESLNYEKKLRQALLLACEDLIRRAGGSTLNAPDLVQQYLRKVERPKTGAAAIAALLQDRQNELDLSDEEFAKFCDSYRISRVELRSIFAGGEIASTQLGSLSRILGKPVDELIELWKAPDEKG